MRDKSGPQQSSFNFAAAKSRGTPNDSTAKAMATLWLQLRPGQEPGDGPAAQALNPPPANIAATSRMPMATDGYLYWTIVEGGAPLKSAMPAFQGALKPDQIWQIILYLRQL
jgi:hypothetical protein